MTFSRMRVMRTAGAEEHLISDHVALETFFRTCGATYQGVFYLAVPEWHAS